MAGVSVCDHGFQAGYGPPCPDCPEKASGAAGIYTDRIGLSRFDVPLGKMFEPTPPPAMRKFDTGATRNTDENKLDFEGFYSPLVMRRFSEYMHKNRVQADGALRASDNWQKGIPKDAYMKSGFRHFFDWWENHRGASEVDLEEALCALLFNTQGYLFEILKEKK